MSDATLTVYAIRDGFYDAYRKPGDAFTIRNPEQSFSDRWMVLADTAEGRAFIKRHTSQTDAAIDAITGERIQSGGDAEHIAILMRQMAELKADLAAATGNTLAAKAAAARSPAEPEKVKEAEKVEEPEAAEEPEEPADKPTAPPRRRRAANK